MFSTGRLSIWILFAVLCALVHASPVNNRGRSWGKTLLTITAKRANAESNAMRLQRGLGPLPPKRRYDPTHVHSAPKARLSAQPGDPDPPGGAGSYSFQSCYGSLNSYYGDHPLTEVTDAGAVNDCAVQAADDDKDNFAVIYVGGSIENYVCRTGVVTPESGESCTHTDWAYYGQAG